MAQQQTLVPGRHIPYLVGGFMLLPYGIWLVVWGFFLPGPKHGFDVPLSIAMFAVSVPLVAWFFLVNLGFMSNSIAGADAFDRPRGRWVRWILAKLPVAALVIGCATLPYLFLRGEPLLMVPLPLVVAVLIAWAISRGEAARAHERSGSTREAAALGPGRGHAAGRLLRVAGEALFLIPVVGQMLREAAEGSDEDRTFFAINLVLTALLLVLIFGFQALFVVALALVPVVFLAMFALTAG